MEAPIEEEPSLIGRRERAVWLEAAEELGELRRGERWKLVCTSGETFS